jgi:prepilin-type N-terminal cleavage/methylation domain-containing protein
LSFLFFLSLSSKESVMRRKNVGRGFTLVELLVVIAIIGILVALLLPAIQAAREAARRTQCNNNLKNITLGLQNYHDTYKQFPAGVIVVTNGVPLPANAGAQLMGPSWWYGTLPFMEQRNIYDKIGAVMGAGGANAATVATMPAAIQVLLNDLAPSYMRCPSSPLPTVVATSDANRIFLPSYVGVMGGDDIYNDPTTKATILYKNRNVETVTFKGGGNAIATASGMLTANEAQNMASCSDGTSNTMIVAEAGDWLSDTSAATTKYHGDFGWHGAATTQGGWLCGTTSWKPIRTAGTFMGSGNGELWNLTTVRWTPQKKDVVGGAMQFGTTVAGVTTGTVGSEEIGHNNPIQSAHPGGLLVALVDGSVQFMAQTVDMNIALRVAIRDDGQNIGDW